VSHLNFFLWDQIEDSYSQRGSRPDRIKIFHLRWSIDELKTMLSMRLKAHSEGKVSSLNELISPDVGVDLDKLVVHFAAGSPRDMIRVCHRIIDEETRASTASTQIRSQSVWTGLRNFAQERSEELFGTHLPQLRRPGSVCFTINQLANDVFRISTQAARNKVQNWMNSAAVTKIGELPNKGNRPLHLFGAIDLRLAVAMLPAQEIQMILANFAIECPSCGTTCITDQTRITCHSCDMEFQLGDAQSLMQSCSMQEA
jgi:Zn finger protein HypA/HybF involved in hydrogenase expression